MASPARPAPRRARRSRRRRGPTRRSAPQRSGRAAAGWRRRRRTARRRHRRPGRVALDHEHPVGHAVALGVVPGRRHGLGIEVDGRHRAGAEPGGGHRQHAAAAPEVEHPVTGAARRRRAAASARRVEAWAPLPKARPGSTTRSIADGPASAGGETHGGRTTIGPTRTGRAWSRQASRAAPRSTGTSSAGHRPADRGQQRRGIAAHRWSGDEHHVARRPVAGSFLDAGGARRPQGVGRQLDLGRGRTVARTTSARSEAGIIRARDADRQVGRASVSRKSPAGSVHVSAHGEAGAGQLVGAPARA